MADSPSAGPAASVPPLGLREDPDGSGTIANNAKACSFERVHVAPRFRPGVRWCVHVGINVGGASDQLTQFARTKVCRYGLPPQNRPTGIHTCLNSRTCRNYSQD